MTDINTALMTRVNSIAHERLFAGSGCRVPGAAVLERDVNLIDCFTIHTCAIVVLVQRKEK